MTVPLGNIQYGQTRDIFVRFGGKVGSNNKIHAELYYLKANDTRYYTDHDIPVTQTSTIPEKEMAFHENRSRICRFILELFPRGELGFPIDSTASIDRVNPFLSLVNDLTVKHYDDRGNQALNEQVEGLIRQAAYADGYEWARWGKHYLLGLWGAHARQLRTTFLDPGVREYDVGSPLFAKCRNRLAKAFEEEVVPPTPSRPEEADPAYSSGSATLSMASYSIRSMTRSNNAYAVSSDSQRNTGDSEMESSGLLGRDRRD